MTEGDRTFPLTFDVVFAETPLPEGTPYAVDATWQLPIIADATATQTVEVEGSFE